MNSKPIAVVTGGAGFIGSHMVDLLVERGFAVRVIDNMVGGREENLAVHRNNPDVTLEQRDIRSYAASDAFLRMRNMSSILLVSGISSPQSSNQWNICLPMFKVLFICSNVPGKLESRSLFMPHPLLAMDWLKPLPKKTIPLTPSTLMLCQSTKVNKRLSTGTMFTNYL